MLLVHVDDDFLDGLEPLPGFRIGVEHDARTRYGQLESLAPHRLDQDAELQFTAPGDLIGVAILRLGNPESDVAFGFAKKAVADDAALHLVALLP